MQLDAQMVLSSAVALTADAGSTNIYDLGVAGRDIGAGRPMSIYIHTTVAADFTSTNETYQFDLRTDDNTSMSSPTILFSSAILYSALTANSINEIVIPAGLTYERYIDVGFDGGGTTPTVTVSIFIAPTGSKTSMRKYANGYDA